MEKMINKGFVWSDNFVKIEPTRLKDNAIELISKRWMLVGAGDASNFNCLTASWGALGFIWNVPTLTAYIRDNRYTYEYMMAKDTFCISILGEKDREIMTYCGKNSGRNGDKIAASGLKPITTPEGEISYEQAEIVIECKKLYLGELDLGKLMPEVQNEITEAYYTKDSALHQQFIAQITGLWIKKQA